MTFFLLYISILVVGVVLFIEFIFKSKKVNCSFSLLPCTKNSTPYLYEVPKGCESFVLEKSSQRLSSKTVEIKPFKTYIRVSQTLRVPVSAD